MFRKFILFMSGWILGVFVLNKLVFQILLESIKTENAVASICIITTIVFTVVFGTIIGTSK